MMFYFLNGNYHSDCNKNSSTVDMYHTSKCKFNLLFFLELKRRSKGGAMVPLYQ